MVFALLAAALLLAAPPAVSGANAPRRALRAMAAAPQASSPPAPWAAWALWPARPQGAPPRRWLHEADPAQPAPSPPRTAPAPAPAPTDNLPDLMIPEGPASLATWFRSAVDMRPIGTPVRAPAAPGGRRRRLSCVQLTHAGARRAQGDDVMNLSYRRLALMLDALERPPEAWQQLTDVVDAFGETVKQARALARPAHGPAAPARAVALRRPAPAAARLGLLNLQGGWLTLQRARG